MFVFFFSFFCQLISILLEVFGSLEFLGNEVGDTAALELLSSAQVRLHQGAHMEFRRNKGRQGCHVHFAASNVLCAIWSIYYHKVVLGKRHGFLTIH